VDNLQSFPISFLELTLQLENAIKVLYALSSAGAHDTLIALSAFNANVQDWSVHATFFDAEHSRFARLPEC